ncbi:xanthine dehydrogenase family protein molybdopterin-binding subunit [Thermomicrobiaceae bacterium CFH 74404]|uniref:Xanthine dehydrogenase family protein molybdopterin-binding subunit n=1 Tax=Thermalbibacter longus TaxID=2951981 RepID=A0AA41WG28_9BACT|nr:xanthine dehydrogenase family protein molybdopterin-binding subunit [Thermalbibacter longus]MCM8749934.1 xanthine dehydrogenase family protein molybdopterin-binding subunit [Thermalbibacter longus]
MSVGRAVPMIDAVERVTGRIRFSQDASLPGMLHAAAVRSVVPHGRIARVDTAAALEVPGVVAVVTGEDLRRLPGLRPVYGPQIEDQPVVALDRVRYVGDIVALVAAETPRAAQEAAALVTVEYEELPAVFDPLDALEPGAPLLHELEPERPHEGTALYFGIRPQFGTNCCNLFRIRRGDVARGFAEADLVLEETFRTPAIQHVAMEPHAALALWEDGRLTVWSGTQTPFNTRQILAGIFGLPVERVRVVVPPMGGSYGCKVFPRIEPQAALLAYVTGRPVKFVLRRDEEFVTLTRHATVVTIRLGLKRDGRITAREVRAYWNTGAYADCGPDVARKGGFGIVGPYRIPNVAVDSRCVYTNLPPAGAFRGYAVTQATWASESMMDLAADALGLDPLEFRLRNLLRDGETFATGETLHDVHFAECLERAAAAIGWEGPQRRELGDGRVRAKGLAVVMKGMTTPSRSEAKVGVDRSGQVTVYSSTVELGQGARTVLAQLAAEALGVPYQQVRVVDPDTDRTPFDNRTTSSRSTYMMGNAVRQAALALRERLLLAAAQRLEVEPADLELVDGNVRVAGAPASALTFGQLVEATGQEELVEHGEFRNQGGLDPDTGQGIASSHWHQGAGAVEVEVDTRTGKVTILHAHASVYAGQVVNWHTAELQNLGCIVFGVGSALFEELVYDQGQLVNPNLSDYLIPSFLDLPERMTHDLIERPGAEIHGLGETALPPIPAAVGNAVARAIGARVTELPLTPERVLRAIRARDGERG